MTSSLARYAAYHLSGAGFPLRVDEAALKQIKSDFRRLTKMYRAAPTGRVGPGSEGPL